MEKAAEEALLDVFSVAFEEADIRFENSFYYIIDATVSKMAANVSPDDLFERNLARRTQSSSSIDASSQHVISIHISCGQLRR